MFEDDDVDFDFDLPTSTPIEIVPQSGMPSTSLNPMFTTNLNKRVSMREDSIRDNESSTKRKSMNDNDSSSKRKSANDNESSSEHKSMSEYESSLKRKSMDDDESPIKRKLANGSESLTKRKSANNKESSTKHESSNNNESSTNENESSKKRTPTSTDEPRQSTLDCFIELAGRKPTTTRSYDKKAPVRKIRKFPGPAGLFDESDSFAGVDEESFDRVFCNNESTTKCEESLECSDDCFASPVWLRMKDEFGGSEEEIFSRYNISSIKPGVKNKFLAALITEWEYFDSEKPQPTLTLRDPTGQIKAVLHYDLYKRHSKQVTTGSVILIKDFSVLILPGTEKRNVVITGNNLVAIYCRKLMSLSGVRGASTQFLQEFTQVPMNGGGAGEVEVIRLGELDFEF